MNLAALAFGPLPFRLYGEPLTLFDIAGLAVLGGMLSLLSARAARNLERLARAEPPGMRRPRRRPRPER